MTNNVKYIRTCSIWRALEVIGDKPTLLIMESYWLGSRRFADFQHQTGLLKTVISDRLQKLIDADCIKKVPYSARPQRYEYRATEKFLDIYPTALCMLHWEKKWGRSVGKIELALTHNDCGGRADPIPACGQCDHPIDPRDVSWKEGPGVGKMKASYSRRRRASNSNQAPTPLFEDIAEIIGDRWSALIIRSVFTGINRYQDIQADSAIATNILSARLTELCDKEILQKYCLKDRKRARYKLTPKGRDIYPVLISLMKWGDRWYPAPEGSPLLLTHDPCASPLDLTLTCQTCQSPVTFKNMRFEIFEAETISEDSIASGK